MFTRKNLPRLIDRAPVVLIAGILIGSALAFGGAVWWVRPVLAASLALLLIATCLRAGLAGSWSILKSPMAPLGVLALVLALVQLAPVPGSLASRVSPHSHALHSQGILPDLARKDDPTASLPDPAGSRTPASVDRSATLRWLLGGAACLALFCVVAHDTDRLDRTWLIWGSVIGPVFLFSIFGLIQLIGGVDGLYGQYTPGQGPAWAPSMADQLSVPGGLVYRRLGDPAQPDVSWVVPVPIRPALFGGLMGGPGAFLALGALALPLALGLALQTIAPRGSREPLSIRLFHSNRGGIALLILALLLISTGLTGVLAGRYLCLPFALGLILAGLPGARAAGLGVPALVTTSLAVLTLAGGVWIGEAFGRPDGGSPLASADGWPAVRALWTETARIAGDFPILGSGLGSFPAIHPYYKNSHMATTTAWSSLLRFWSEAGLAGLALLGLALTWAAIRLPVAMRRIGSGDAVLGFALIGSMVGFATFSAIHWTVELTAVALAASAVAGTLDRWLAGGTDLFVEPS